ncbi:hypothetical protein ELZ19_06760 [Brucella abortus]|uniref:hypothetical protein n=1 Tax=Brucella abortus TaxID=235 RepID=UPI0004E908BE|nr:hypothetical protein [Brucella abortus]KFH18420.1 hypothetical protein IB60_17065 [Brucella abortus LMN1]RUQ67350.1 hypothetical protein ELZ23_15595 [Brucella abortus]RUQ77622.1 hypothetical protein ELZ22_17675 [Brucella abortus]RUQ88263.1 hypothetical protein ELZ18_15485 [Brucella abortus]RUQ90292.1 hypothetical protein ELZ20_15480 [Brucella abortus]
MTDYAPLLEATEEQVRVDLTPEDAIKLVTRLRRVSFFLRVALPLIVERTEEGARVFDIGENLPVSAAQALSVLEKKRDENAKRIAAKGPEKAGRVEVTRLGRCLFIG